MVDYERLRSESAIFIVGNVTVFVLHVILVGLALEAGVPWWAAWWAIPCVATVCLTLIAHSSLGPDADDWGDWYMLGMVMLMLPGWWWYIWQYGPGTPEILEDQPLPSLMLLISWPAPFAFYLCYGLVHFPEGIEFIPSILVAGVVLGFQTAFFAEYFASEAPHEAAESEPRQMAPALAAA